MLFRNTLATSTPTILGYVFAFIIGPIMLSRLGLAAFGVWAVTGAVAHYFGLLDLGLRRSLARFIALYDANGDVRGIKECVGLGLIAFTVVGAVGVLAAVASAPLFTSALGVLEVEEMRLVLISSATLVAAFGFVSVLNAVGDGLRRMVPGSTARLINIVLNFVFSLTALLLSGDLVVYALANAAAGVLGIVPAVVALRYVWSGPFPLALPSLARARELITFGLKTQVHGLSDLVNGQTDKIILAFLVDVRAAAVYEIGRRVAAAVKAIALLSIGAMTSPATAHIVKHGRESIPAWYRRYTRRVTALAFPLFVVTCVTAPFLLLGWLDQIPGEGDSVVLMLSLGFFIAVTTEVGRTTAVADGRPGLVASNSSITAALNVALTLVLAPFFGFWGVLWGTFLAMALGAFLFVVRFHREYGIPLAVYFRQVGPPAALSFATAVPFSLVYLFQDGLLESRWTALVALAGIGGPYMLVYWLAASRLGYLPDKLTLSRLRPRVKAEVSA